MKKMKRKNLIILCTFVSITTFLFSSCGMKTINESSKTESTETAIEQIQVDEPEAEETNESIEQTQMVVPETETDEEKTDGLAEIFNAGDSKNDAALIPLGERITGTIDDDEEDWYAFTTGDNPNTVYNITFINTTVNSPILYVDMYSEDGTKKGHDIADYLGNAITISMDGVTCGLLDANTVYYIRLTTHGNGDTDYSLVIKDPNSETTSYQTVGDIIEARGVSQMGEVYAGTNQYEAALIPFEVKVSGTIRDGRTAWFAFKTKKDRGISYYITFENCTKDTYPLGVNVYDEYGDWQPPGASARSEEGPVELIMDKLDPDTIYYVRLESSDILDYSLMIDAPEEEIPLKVEEPLVFEIPFEINETQVQFVINEAEFIDIEQAKEALKPVAEAILEYPEHSLLIAGTTATDGTQESCVDLSNRRAQAVKDLLIDTYAVPESQLQIIGLGYEKDPFERGRDRDSNGNFVESEGKKNRRVVILDLDDPIAQEILENNQ